MDLDVNGIKHQASLFQKLHPEKRFVNRNHQFLVL